MIRNLMIFCAVLIINNNLQAQYEYNADEMTKITDDIAILKAKIDKMEKNLSKAQQSQLELNEQKSSLDKNEDNQHFKGYQKYGDDTFFKIDGKVSIGSVFLPNGKNQNSAIAFDPSMISFDKDPGNTSKPQLFANVMGSKLGFSFGRVIDCCKIEGKLSLDFFGALKDKEEKKNNASCARLRDAYLKLSSTISDKEPTLIVGQTTSLFSDPNIMLFGASQIMFAVFQPQFRITKKVENVEYALSIENPETDFILRPKKEDIEKGIDKDFKYKTDSGKNGGFGVDSLPDFVLRYMVCNNECKRYFSMRTVLRMLQAKEKVHYKVGGEDKYVSTDSKRMFGFGMGLSGKMPLDDKTSVMFNTVLGYGIGRYARMGAENCAAVFDLASSDFENIETFVIGAAIERQLNDNLTASLVFTTAHHKYPDMLKTIPNDVRDGLHKQLSIIAVNCGYKLNNAIKITSGLGKGFKTSETNKKGNSFFTHIGMEASF